MKKFGKALLVGATMALLMTSTVFAAGGWKKDHVGWWYATNDAGTTWHANGWQWIDGNYDGKAECYYFDPSGYMAENCVTPDGYTVDANGAWTVDGQVQIKNLDPNINRIDVAKVETNGNEVTDAAAVPKIGLNQELYSSFRTDTSENIELLKNATAQNRAGYNYITTYRGKPLEIKVLASIDKITSYYGEAQLILDNIPESGIEVDAFYDNTGLKAIKEVCASTGNSDEVFGLPQASYRFTMARDASYNGYMIMLTHGTDDQWYIYPENMMIFN